MLQNIVYIYTDASFSKNHGLAVIGYMIFRSAKEHEEALWTEIKPVFHEIEETGNIRAEIRGALAALEKCPTGVKVTLYTDCQAVVGLPFRREKLESAGFISKSKHRELANADLYRKFYALYDRCRPEIVWVKGHSSKRLDRIQKNFSYLDKEVRKNLRLKTSD
jgi:ribonuclease HI